MENGTDVKRVVAKLYNLKSYLDGKIMELNEGLATPQGVSEGLALMMAKVIKDLDTM